MPFFKRLIDDPMPPFLIAGLLSLFTWNIFIGVGFTLWVMLIIYLYETKNIWSHLVLVAGMGTAFFLLMQSFIANHQNTQYKGTIQEIANLREGTALDLDGAYPDQKMVAFIPRSSEENLKPFSFKIGEQVTVYGKQTVYKGYKEIIVTNPQQLEL